MLNSYGMFCKVFDMIITVAIIYELFAVPVFLVFNDLYGPSRKHKENLIGNPSLVSIELVIDFLMLLDITANFLKWSR